MNQTNHGAWPAREPAPPQRASHRHLLLMLGLGCFGLLVMACLFIAGVFVVTNLAMRSSDAYQLALTAARREPPVTAALGAPLREGWLTTGEISVAGSSGQASLEIPISGPRGSGTIAARATKAAGKWSFSSLNVRIPGRATPLDLLAATPP